MGDIGGKLPNLDRQRLRGNSHRIFSQTINIMRSGSAGPFDNLRRTPASELLLGRCGDPVLWSCCWLRHFAPLHQSGLGDIPAALQEVNPSTAVSTDVLIQEL